MLNKSVLVAGASGVIGRRITGMLEAAGVPYVAGLGSGSVRNDLAGDSILFERAYLMGDDQFTERKRRAESSGQQIEGAITRNFSWGDVAVVLDCADSEGTLANLQHIYPANVPVIVQGGTKVDRSQFRHFGSVPFGAAASFYTDLPNRTKHLSCNSTGYIQAIGNVVEGVDNDPSRIKGVRSYAFRRHKDPEDSGELIRVPTEFEQNNKYGLDVKAAFPKLTARFTTQANKNPWRSHHYHTLIIDIEGPFDVERIQEVFRNDPRTAYLQRQPTGARRTRVQEAQCIANALQGITQAACDIGLPHADTPVNLAHVYRINRTKIGVDLIVSQRWSPNYGTLDAMLAFIQPEGVGKPTNLQEAQAITNQVLIYDKPVAEHTRYLEEALNF